MPLQLCYILSASHSGSTLMAMLLGAHPEAVTVGELKGTNLCASDWYRCSCGAFAADCRFWSELRRRAKQNGFDLSRPVVSIYEVPSRFARRLLAPLQRGPLLELARDAALSISPAWCAWLRESQLQNAALIEALCETSGARMVVDSSKVALRLKYLLRNPALDIKIIWLIRDGRAVSLTYTDEWTFADSADPTLRGGGSAVRRAPPRTNLAEAAREWRRSNESAACLVRRLPRGQWLGVRYEDLCRDPLETLRHVCGFLGLAPELINLNFRSRPQHVFGNGMRLDSTSEIRLDERWRSQLVAEDLANFEHVAGPLNREYGYS